MANTFESPLEIRLLMSLGQLNPAQSEIHKSVTTPHPGGGLPFEKVRTACCLTQGCKIEEFGLTTV